MHSFYTLPGKKKYDLGKCEKFGSKNVVSGEITHVYAESCRIDTEQCGKTGKYFEKKICKLVI